MDGSNADVDVIESLLWTDLECDDTGRVSVKELGRCLREQGVNISDFAILRVASDGQLPQVSIDHDAFLAVKEKLIIEMDRNEMLEAEDQLKKYKAHYLDLWREHSGSKDESGEILLNKLADAVCSECNPTQELLDALVALRSGGSENLTFTEFCQMMENLPRSGMVDENMLLRAFQAEDVDARGYITRTQLYQFLIENGSDPLTKEEVDEMMEDCGSADKFCYRDWIQRVITVKCLPEN